MRNRRLALILIITLILLGVIIMLGGGRFFDSFIYGPYREAWRRAGVFWPGAK